MSSNVTPELLGNMIAEIFKQCYLKSAKIEITHFINQYDHNTEHIHIEVNNNLVISCDTEEFINRYQEALNLVKNELETSQSGHVAS